MSEIKSESKEIPSLIRFAEYKQVSNWCDQVIANLGKLDSHHVDDIITVIRSVLSRDNSTNLYHMLKHTPAFYSYRMEAIWPKCYPLADYHELCNLVDSLLEGSAKSIVFTDVIDFEIKEPIIIKLTHSLVYIDEFSVWLNKAYRQNGPMVDKNTGYILTEIMKTILSYEDADNTFNAFSAHQKGNPNIPNPDTLWIESEYISKYCNLYDAINCIVPGSAGELLPDNSEKFILFKNAKIMPSTKPRYNIRLQYIQQNPVREGVTIQASTKQITQSSHTDTKESSPSETLLSLDPVDNTNIDTSLINMKAEFSTGRCAFFMDMRQLESDKAAYVTYKMLRFCIWKRIRLFDQERKTYTEARLGYAEFTGTLSRNQVRIILDDNRGQILVIPVPSHMAHNDRLAWCANETNRIAGPWAIGYSNTKRGRNIKH